MTTESNKDFWEQKPPSLFFPLLLIGIGVILLLKTLGLLGGNLWDMFLKGWPVLLIAGGLDGIYRRDGIVGGVVWAGLGAIILMANLGYLAPIYWNVILRIWPFALVVWGLDILLGRRRWWTAVLAFVTGLAVVGLIYWVILAAPVARATHSETFEVPLENAKQAAVELDAVTGKFILEDGAASGNLADGAAQLFENEDFLLDYSVQEGTGHLSLKNSKQDETQIWFPGTSNNREWQLNLANSIPIDLTMKLVMGDQKVDLSGIMLDDMKLEAVLGQSVITLPEKWTGAVQLDVVMGQLVVKIPEDVPITVYLDTAITALDYPDDFQRTGDILRSPGAGTAEDLEIHLNLPIGGAQIKYID